MSHSSPDSAETALRRTLDEAMTRLAGGPLSDDDYALVTAQQAHPNRDYHGMSHARDMGSMSQAEKEKFGRDIGNPAKAEALEALINVAGAFHDNAYLQVDGDVSAGAKAILSRYVRVTGAAGGPTDTYGNDSVYRLRTGNEQTQAQRDVQAIVCRIFGRNPDDSETPLPPLKDGPFLNEFLSALVAADTLKKYGVGNADIAKAAALIEGTIPFGDTDRFVQLKERVSDANQALRLGLSDDEIGFAMKAAVFLANKDVLAFAGCAELSDAGLRRTETEGLRNYLRSTWSLMPETNPLFRDPEQKYTPGHFKEKLMGRRGFEAGYFVPEARQIFHQYDHYPPQADFDRLQTLEKNVREHSLAYLEAKIVSAAFVEAIADKSGSPDAPLGEWMGTGMGERLRTRALTMPGENAVFKLLQEGRGDSPVFDVPDSPIAAFIVAKATEKLRGDETGKTGLTAVKEIYDRFLAAPRQFYSKNTKNNSTGFLIAVRDAIGKEAFGEIGNQMAEIAQQASDTRRAAQIRNAIQKIAEPSAGQAR